MKRILVCSLLVLVTPLFGKEIDLRTPAWDDLSIPLGITSLYLSIDSPKTAHQVSIEMEIYKQGKLQRTIDSVGITALEGKPPPPLKLNCAIYFTPKDPKYDGKMIIDWGGNYGAADFNVAMSEIRFDKGIARSAFGQAIGDDARIPVFQVITGVSSFSPGNTPAETLRANPQATVLIGYLVKK